MPTVFSALSDDEREIPVVLVQVDGNDETFPCSATVKRLVPITPMLGGTVNPTSIACSYRSSLLMRTAHSVQGFTAPDGVVVDTGSMFFAGDYVANVLLLRPATAAYFTSHNDYTLMVGTTVCVQVFILSNDVHKDTEFSFTPTRFATKRAKRINLCWLVSYVSRLLGPTKFGSSFHFESATQLSVTSFLIEKFCESQADSFRSLFR